MDSAWQLLITFYFVIGDYRALYRSVLVVHRDRRKRSLTPVAGRVRVGGTSTTHVIGHIHQTGWCDHLIGFSTVPSLKLGSIQPCREIHLSIPYKSDWFKIFWNHLVERSERTIPVIVCPTLYKTADIASNVENASLFSHQEKGCGFKGYSSLGGRDSDGSMRSWSLERRRDWQERYVSWG